MTKSIIVILTSLALPAFAGEAWQKVYLSPTETDSVILPLHLHSTQKILFLNGWWKINRSGAKDTASVKVPGVYDFEGKVEFVRYFKLDSTFFDLRLKLVALGVNSQCKIFLNNHFLASHSGGHTPFFVELPRDKVFITDRNTLKIIVDNTRLPRNSLPLQHSPGLSKNYGGIFRDIYLVAVPAVSIEDISLRTEFSDNFASCQLSVTTRLKEENIILTAGVDKSVRLRVEVRDSTGKYLLAKTPRETVVFDREVLVHTVTLDISRFKLWSPANPMLYQLRVYLADRGTIIDEHEQLFGFNRVDVDSGRICLNGIPVTIQGLTWVEDYPDAGPIFSRKRAMGDLMQMKQLGANAVRVAGAPPHPAFLDICDKLGLLVFIEGPLSSVPANRLADSAFRENAANYYQEMLENLAIHPSVAGWGLGTDLLVKNQLALKYITEIKQAIARRSSRPVYTVENNFTINSYLPEVELIFKNFVNARPQEIEDWLNMNRGSKLSPAKIVMLGYSLGYEPEAKNSNFEKHVTVAEQTGSIAQQERQAYQLNSAFTAVKLARQPAGILIANFSDWRTGRQVLRLGPRADMFLMTTGLYSFNRNKRIVANVVASVFKENHGLKITATNQAEISPTVYPVTGLAVILGFLFYFNRSRRLRGNLKRIFLHPHGFYTEIRENRKTSYLHSFLISIVAVSSLAIVSSGIVYNFHNQPLFDNLIDLFTTSPAVKSKLIWLIWNPGPGLAIIAVVLYLLFALVILLLKLASMILGKHLPFGQLFTLVSWSSANFIWLLPIVPIYYRIINQTNWSVVAFIVFTFILIWMCIRLIRAIKVVFRLTMVRTLFLAFILVTIVVGSLGLYYDDRFALFEYLPMYWDIIKNELSVLPLS